MTDQPFDNTNKGTLFINTDKEAMKSQKDTSKWATLEGSMNLICPHCEKSSDFWLSAWNKIIGTGKRGLN